MKAHQLTGTAIGAVTTSANLFSLAVARTEISSQENFVFYASEQATGTTIFSQSNTCGGDDLSIPQVTPDFFPYATAGAECAALVTDLSWAEQNLSDFEFLLLSKASGLYFVTGILNSSKTEFNDPFGATAVSVAACWAGTYVKNLFA